MEYPRAPGISFIRRWSFALAVTTAVAAAQPAVSRNGVRNAASLFPASRQSSPVARAARLNLRGAGFGSDTRVTIAGLASPLLSRTEHELELLVPAAAPLGDTVLTVHSAGKTSAPQPIRITASAIGLYTKNGEGWGPAKNDPQGRRLTLQATGAAATPPPEIWIGGKPARFLAAGPAKDGIQPLAIEIPTGAPEGCYVPVIARQGGTWSNTVTIAVTRQPGACTLPAALPFAQWKGKPSAVVFVTRSQIEASTGRTRIADEAGAAFLRPGPNDTLGRPVLVPPIGTCTAYLTGNGPEISLAGSFAALLMAALAGDAWDVAPKLSIIQGGWLHSIPRIPGAPGRYRSSLSPDRGAPPGPLSLDKGAFTISGPDGRGPLNIPLPAPAAFTCSNCGGLTEVDRTRPLTLHWSGTQPSITMAIILASSDTEAFTQGSALCLVPAAAGQFTIPTSALVHMPVSPQASGLISLVALANQPSTFVYPGAERTAAGSVYIYTRETRFR